LIAFDDLIPVDLLSGLFIDSLVADPGKVTLVEQIEVQPV
jgi:hypothetical protein